MGYNLYYCSLSQTGALRLVSTKSGWPFFLLNVPPYIIYLTNVGHFQFNAYTQIPFGHRLFY